MVRKCFVAHVSNLQLRGFVMVDLMFIAVSYLMYLGIVASVLMPALHHLFCRRHPQIRFDDFPSSVRFAKNVTHFLIEILGSPRNFGHNVYRNMASVYHAMESFAFWTILHASSHSSIH